MPLSLHKLKRFLNVTSGPIISVVSIPHADYPGGCLWQTMAQLHPDCFFTPELKHPRVEGVGWSRDMDESWRKAIVEAIECWAYNMYVVKYPKEAGLHINDWASGFAAMPAEMGSGQAALHGYCEALERWVLNSLWDDKNVFFTEYPVRSGALDKFIRTAAREWSCFGLEIVPEKITRGMPDLLHFRLCLLKLMNGGVVSGQACAESAAGAFDSAVSEVIDHMAMAAPSLERIVEPRMGYFAKLLEGYKIVKGHIKIGAPGPHTPPRVRFSKNLPGPWEPEVKVHRILLDDIDPVMALRNSRNPDIFRGGRDNSSGEQREQDPRLALCDDAPARRETGGIFAENVQGMSPLEVRRRRIVNAAPVHCGRCTGTGYKGGPT